MADFAAKAISTRGQQGTVCALGKMHGQVGDRVIGTMGNK
ncbi:hypothetical protein N483_15710 [Pseudoalteromonas luteoviolacea NCIMB 1944]|uniref:Uncharacterized protein n=1 Tax=Pseudoalteromonas luteoviolacea (strain 2ta16) TaxID=1353533 RepID=V4H0Z9_PSEL2|nr:hypothetical protein PL2TA16_01133 [Pseudoalteromonas luteoviolacea 2ta16]KZN41341.1 hypothetical protein N483_15710 [Pseudoalteromonas luteoviolacea NCIMB 1944]